MSSSVRQFHLENKIENFIDLAPLRLLYADDPLLY